MKNLVILTGAGISAESGLRTFRDSDGLWEGYDIEEVASPQGWAKNQKLVLGFYNMRRREVANAHPNAAHLALAALEKDFQVHIITQNIDDLHERAGSTNVLHLHGEIFKMRGENGFDEIAETRGDILPGHTTASGVQYRPHIVWFGEAVPMMQAAAAVAAQADVFVIIGTSLAVYPAASLIDWVPQHAKVFILDKNIPQVFTTPDITKFEKPATEGIVDLTKALELIK